MLRAYYQLTKPGIIKGNLLTTAAGFLLAAEGHVNWGRLLATLVGTSLVIGSACVCNNYLDRNIDKKMARTRNRASVTGAVSLKRGLSFATVIGVLGFGALLLWVNVLTAELGAIAFVAYVALYGYTKRRSVHGTLVGSVSGAIPPVAGYAAASNQLGTAASLLFLIMTFWQMPHFYAIAMYRLKDYQAAGIPVLPAVKDVRQTKIQIFLYIIGFGLACSLLTITGYTGWSFLVTMTALTLYWLNLGRRKLPDEQWGKRIFLFSLIVVMVLSLGLSVDHFLP